MRLVYVTIYLCLAGFGHSYAADWVVESAIPGTLMIDEALPQTEGVFVVRKKALSTKDKVLLKVAGALDPSRVGVSEALPLLLESNRTVHFEFEEGGQTLRIELSDPLNKFPKFLNNRTRTIPHSDLGQQVGYLDRVEIRANRLPRLQQGADMSTLELPPEKPEVWRGKLRKKGNIKLENFVSSQTGTFEVLKKLPGYWEAKTELASLDKTKGFRGHSLDRANAKKPAYYIEGQGGLVPVSIVAQNENSVRFVLHQDVMPQRRTGFIGIPVYEASEYHLLPAAGKPGGEHKVGVPDRNAMKQVTTMAVPNHSSFAGAVVNIRQQLAPREMSDFENTRVGRACRKMLGLAASVVGL